MTEHTPGSWINNGGQIEAAGGTVVATVGIVNEQSHQDTANARLIAAALAMQEAAQALLDWQANVGEDGYALEDMDVLPHLIEDLAIAQARGETTHA